MQAWSQLERNSNIAKFLKASFPKNICERLLLYVPNPNFKWCNLHTSQKLSVIGFKKYFFTSSALQTLVSPRTFKIERITIFIFFFCIGLVTQLNDSALGVLEYHYITKRIGELLIGISRFWIYNLLTNHFSIRYKKKLSFRDWICGNFRPK